MRLLIDIVALPIMVLALACPARADGAAPGPSGDAQHPLCAQRIGELSRQVASLEAEVTALRLQWTLATVQSIEGQLARVAADRAVVEQDDKSNRDELLNAEIQLARRDLSEEERTELQNLRNALFTDAPAAVRQRQSTASASETALRDQLARNKAAAEELQKRLQLLQRPANR
jgi:hypothetical protein